MPGIKNNKIDPPSQLTIPSPLGEDTLAHQFDSIKKRLKSIPDTMIKSVVSQIKNAGIKSLNILPGMRNSKTDSSKKSLQAPLSFDALLNTKNKPLPLIPKFSKPFLSVSNGRVDYSSYYRSNVDTPYAQKDLYQHQINASVRVLLGNQIPIKVTALFRRTNSTFFKNLNNVLVEFDVEAMLQGLRQNAIANVRLSEYVRDSIIGYAARLKLSEYTNLHEHFSNKFNEQNLIGANEMLNVPEVSWDVRLPDSLAKIKSDSMKQTARAFIKLYEQSKAKIDSIKKVYDSLSTLYNELTNKLSDTKGSLEGSARNYFGNKASKYRNAIEKNGEELLPKKYRWLLGLRKFAVGKSFLKYSILTPFIEILLADNSE